MVSTTPLKKSGLGTTLLRANSQPTHAQPITLYLKIVFLFLDGWFSAMSNWQMAIFPTK